MTPIREMAEADCDTVSRAKEARIPEIVDFNVLVKYRRLGIGTAWMDGIMRTAID